MAAIFNYGGIKNLASLKNKASMLNSKGKKIASKQYNKASKLLAKQVAKSKGEI